MINQIVLLLAGLNENIPCAVLLLSCTADCRVSRFSDMLFLEAALRVFSVSPPVE